MLQPLLWKIVRSTASAVFVASVVTGSEANADTITYHFTGLVTFSQGAVPGLGGNLGDSILVSYTLPADAADLEPIPRFGIFDHAGSGGPATAVIGGLPANADLVVGANAFETVFTATALEFERGGLFGFLAIDLFGVSPDMLGDVLPRSITGFSESNFRGSFVKESRRGNFCPPDCAPVDAGFSGIITSVDIEFNQTPVPEPATLTLFVIGAVGAVVRARGRTIRRRR
jgi:hypothetical protein